MKELWERLAERVFASVPEMITLPSLPDLEEGGEVPVRLAPEFNPLDRVLRTICLEEVFVRMKREDSRDETIVKLRDGRLWMWFACVFFLSCWTRNFYDEHWVRLLCLSSRGRFPLVVLRLKF